MIHTPRLTLVPVLPSHRTAFHSGTGELARVLGVDIPRDWPQFPRALEPLGAGVDGAKDHGGWGGYFFIHALGQSLIGNGGFKGPPDSAGAVEIGYEVAPEHRGKGYATEAALFMIDHAFGDDRVLRVTAQTLPVPGPSCSVLRKAGMKLLDGCSPAGQHANWQWAISR